MLVLYPVRQFIVQGLILGHAPSSAAAPRRGHRDRRNVAMAAMEALTYLATALAVVQLL